jgi:hypothetical protein
MAKKSTPKAKAASTAKSTGKKQPRVQKINPKLRIVALTK